MSLTFTPGIDNEGIIRGTDKYGVEGAMRVYTAGWDRYQELMAAHERGDAADAAILEFFKPLTDALEDLRVQPQEADPIQNTRVIHEAVEGEQAVPAVAVNIGYHGMLIAAILEGHEDRLAWVGNELMIEALPTPKAKTSKPKAKKK